MTQKEKNKNLYLLLIVIEQIVLLALITVTVLTLKEQSTANTELTTAVNIRHESSQLADDLRHTSDDLTRMVRSYAVTGDPKFERYFYEILDMRDGKIARPLKNYKIFWDLKIVEDSLFEYEVGETVSINTLFKRVGITDTEFSLLDKAKQKSDKLVELESVAMHAVKGEFRNKKGIFEKNSEPDQTFAINILLGDEYLKTKMVIMSLINEFYTSIDLRTKEVMEEKQEQVNSLATKISILFFLLILVVPAVIATLYYYQKLVMVQLKKSLADKTEQITERENAEKKLRSARNYISNIINSMPSTLIGVDSECNVTQWNSIAEETIEIAESDAVGQPLVNVFPDFESEIKNINEAIRTREVSKGRKRIVKTLSGNRHEDITIYPLVANGIEGAVIRIDDITKEIEMEEKLNHRSKMDSIGQLAGGVAHDFNNMIAGIMGAAQILKSPKRDLTEDDIKFVDMIISCSQRAADLTAKLLAFGRKGKVMSTDLSMHGIIKDSVAILERTIDKNIPISVNLNSKNDTVVGDDSSLQNAFMNIGINASHAMEKGGEITINTKDVNLSKSYCLASPFDIEPGDYIEIEINDSGTGIPEDVITKIFDPFFTTKEQGKGTGLGLSAVYGTVQDHHGVVQVYSEDNIGTSFHIYLPCSEKSTKIVFANSTVVTGSGTILLVDDEDIIRATGKQMLEDMGYTVHLAENGQEGVDMFEKNPDLYSMVILDMIMPVMDGKDAFMAMKAIKPDCKVVISSGFAKDTSMSELKEQGLSGFIRKPYVDYDLSTLVSQTISGGIEIK
jgi:PAS domain S-box-containing protein